MASSGALDSQPVVGLRGRELEVYLSVETVGAIKRGERMWPVLREAAAAGMCYAYFKESQHQQPDTYTTTYQAPCQDGSYTIAGGNAVMRGPTAALKAAHVRHLTISQTTPPHQSSRPEPTSARYLLTVVYQPDRGIALVDNSTLKVLYIKADYTLFQHCSN